MGAGPREVKKQRSYDATRRQERAREQRERVLDISGGLFLDQGYTATTVESIAQVAGVSAATIYKTYGGKAGLVRALCERAMAGIGPIPAHERSNALRESTDPRQVIEGWGRLLAEVSPRISPLTLLLRSAAQSDPEAQALYDEIDGDRLKRMAENARFLAVNGHLRDGVTVRDARDVLWLSSSEELYELLVVRRRWSVAKYGRFVTAAITSALL